MKPLTSTILLATLIIFPCSLANAEDVPQKIIEAAKQVFEEGYEYYIWYEGDEPIEGSHIMGSAFFSIQFRYLSKPDSPLTPFSTQISVVGTGATATSFAAYTSFSRGPRPHSEKSGVEEAYFQFNGKISGEGDADVCLVVPAGKERRLSNCFQVHVTF